MVFHLKTFLILISSLTIFFGEVVNLLNKKMYNKMISIIRESRLNTLIQLTILTLTDKPTM